MIMSENKKGSYLLLEKKMRDLLVYMNIMTKQFPKHEKYLMANKLREYGYTIFELIIICNKKVYKKTDLTLLNIKHELLRQFINLAFELKYIDHKKHRYSSLLVDEIGKMVGAWIKKELTPAVKGAKIENA